jgi:hypothetical protein
MTSRITSGRSSSALAIAATILAAAIVSVSFTPNADAYPLSMTAAGQLSSAAVGPAPVEAVRCFRQPGFGGREGRRRAFCIVMHGTHNGETCRSFVLLRSPRGAFASAGSGVRASMLGSNVCEPAFTGIEP